VLHELVVTHLWTLCKIFGTLASSQITYLEVIIITSWQDVLEMGLIRQKCSFHMTDSKVLYD